MLQKLGAVGVVGLLLILAGIGVVAYANPVVAAGIGAVVVGIGLVVYGLVNSMLGFVGMDV